MRSPFPGMDPYLEHPALWPDLHNSLIAALRDDLAPRVAPRYFVALERMTHLIYPDDIVFVGRPDLAVASEAHRPPRGRRPRRGSRTEAAVIEVEVPMLEEVNENYLEIREVVTGLAIAVVEILSPANKIHARGRAAYEAKRSAILGSRTHLIEVDLLRTGEPMPVSGPPIESDYRILISRSDGRPRARMLAYSVRQPIPTFHLPLLPGDPEPEVELGKVLHALYGRARFDLRLDYRQPPNPPLTGSDRDWARKRVEAWRKN